MSSNIVVSKYIPTLITALVGFLMLAEYILNISWLKGTASEIQNWGVVVGGFAIGLGVANLTLLHGRRIQKMEKGLWFPSILLLASMYVMIIMGIPTIVGNQSMLFNFLYQYLQSPLVVTTKGLLAFFILSAAYRAFRPRSMDAVLMLVSAFCVMFFMVPLGIYMGPVPIIGEWLRDVPMTVMGRVINMGALIGLVSLGIRTLIGRGGGLARLLKIEEATEG